MHCVNEIYLNFIKIRLMLLLGSMPFHCIVFTLLGYVVRSLTFLKQQFPRNVCGSECFHLSRLVNTLQPLLQEKVNLLDKHNMSRYTNLSAGLRTALKVFYDGINE